MIKPTLLLRRYLDTIESPIVCVGWGSTALNAGTMETAGLPQVFGELGFGIEDSTFAFISTFVVLGVCGAGYPLMCEVTRGFYGASFIFTFTIFSDPVKPLLGKFVGFPRPLQQHYDVSRESTRSERWWPS
jgi:hypothetical protein